MEAQKAKSNSMFSKDTLTYTFSMALFGTTIWMCAHNDHEMLKWWYIIVMSLLLIIRVPNFFKRKWHHYLYEMCYFANIYAFFNIGTDRDIKKVFPLLHGPLMLYAITFKDAFIPHNLPRSTSYALHSLGTFISRRLYWYGNDTLQLSDLTLGSFTGYAFSGLKFYLMWFIPYAVIVLTYNGYSMTLCREIFRLGKDEKIPLEIKLQYLFGHFTKIMISICIGVILMHCNFLDNIACSVQLLGGILYGAMWYENKLQSPKNM